MKIMKCKTSLIYSPVYYKLRNIIYFFLEMNIKGKIVTLRQMARDDMQMICDMFNDPELENLVVGWAFPLSIEQQQQWLD